MIRYILLMPILILLSLFVKAQSFNTDSMLLLMRTVPENTVKVNVYIDYAVWMESQNTDSAIYYYKKAGELSKELNDHEGQIRYARNYTVVLNQLGRLSESMQINQKALQLAEEKKDSLNMAKCETNLANVHNHQGNFETAIAHYLRATQLFDILKETQYLNIIYQNLSALFEGAEQYHRALEYSRASMTISRSSRDSITLSSVMINTANIFNALHQYDSAIAIATIGLNISKAINSQFNRQAALIAIGNSYAQKEEYGSGIASFRESLYISRQLQYASGTASSLNGLAMSYFKMKDYATADRYAVEALKLSEGSAIFNDLRQQYKQLADIKAHLGDFSNAYHYLQQYLFLNDSLNTVAVRKSIHELERKYQVMQKEKEMVEKQGQLDLANLTVQRRNNWLIVLGAGMLSAAVFLFATLRLHRSRVKRQEERWIALQKEKELVQLQASLNGQAKERKRIAAEMHDDLGTGLTSIMFLAEGIREPNLASGEQAAKIATTTRSLINQVNEIIWSMNTEYDTLEDLIAYIRHTTADFLDNVNLHYKFLVPEAIPSQTVSGVVRRNIYLVVKEALHNIVKHAEASCVQLSFSFSGLLRIQIADNGKGIDTAIQRRFGNGLKNMQQRMEAINGTLSVENRNGTSITLNVPLGV